MKKFKSWQILLNVVNTEYFKREPMMKVLAQSPFNYVENVIYLRHYYHLFVIEQFIVSYI